MSTHDLAPLVDLASTLARRLVDHPDDVAVSNRAGNDGSETLLVRVHADDFGQVIGRQGRTARALRTIVKHAAARRGMRVSLEIAE
jgi:predicted RNA-binding protein YlqC (UPF0109 family)